MRLLSKCQLAVFAGLVLLNYACDNTPKYSFKSSDEALQSCRQKLSALKELKEADTKELADIVADWMVLQDSATAALCNDTSMAGKDMQSLMGNNVFVVADSIREEIMRLAFSQPRTLKDVVYIKAHICQRENTQKDETFKILKKFYEDLDGVQVYPNLGKTLQEYHSLLKTPPFKTEGDMLDFIKKEDCCFRSLLAYLHEVQHDELRNITVQTSELFEEVTKTLKYDDNNEQSKRIQTYLQMRLNRRMIQNAETCQNDLKRNVKLTDIQSANYRWMMIQPFLIIDNDGMACVTDDQLDELEDLAEELPKMLIHLDTNINKGKMTQEEEDKLTDVLSHYLLKTCLSLNI